MDTALNKGYRVSGAVVNLAAAGVANATEIFQISNSSLQIGTKSAKIKKIRIYDNGTGGTAIHIGTGVNTDFVAVLPAIQTVPNMDLVLEEKEIPEVEVFEDLTAYPDSVGSGSIDIQVEVEEIG